MPSLVPFFKFCCRRVFPFPTSPLSQLSSRVSMGKPTGLPSFDTLSIQGAPWRLDFGICGLHVYFAILCLEKARKKANMLHVEAGVSNLRMCCLTSGPNKDKGVGENLPVEVRSSEDAHYDKTDGVKMKRKLVEKLLKGWKRCVCVCVGGHCSTKLSSEHQVAKS